MKYQILMNTFIFFTNTPHNPLNQKPQTKKRKNKRGGKSNKKYTKKNNSNLTNNLDLQLFYGNLMKMLHCDIKSLNTLFCVIYLFGCLLKMNFDIIIRTVYKKKIYCIE